jgi:hypothetical protein
MAAIGWIDFSPSDRNRVGSVLDMLRPEGMVDELGMGTIRDSLANQMFPGFSTIQTKAKYFFIVPYILRDYQVLKPSQRRGKTAMKYLEDQEYEIMWELAEKYKYELGTGVIGITKRRREKIVRRPSAIYWNGLYTYNFINTSGLSSEVFLREATNQSLESLVSVQQGDDGVADDADVDYDNTFKIKVPANLNWRDNLFLDLEKHEAEFFQDRIVSIMKNKLVAELLENDKLWDVFIKSANFMDFVKTSMSLSLPSALQAMLVLAHDFSELMYGAHLAYNSLLQQTVFNSDYFDDDWDRWLFSLQDNMVDYSNFNPDVLFGYATTTRVTTSQFVKNWWQEAQASFAWINKRNNLLEQQEATVKGGKARLRWKKTDDARENNWHGLTHFDYRFYQARTILNDIKTALNQ